MFADVSFSTESIAVVTVLLVALSGAVTLLSDQAPASNRRMPKKRAVARP